MNVPVKLGLFALILCGSFGAGAALGAAVPEIGGDSGQVTEHHSDTAVPSQHTEGP